ncbi:septum formation family protein [Blastococcus sp. TF02-8]|uniref:septum formation family protein n=1 Tax=Blastococcus sp. TF02-8 TaxID=2250574 RepID=UPI001F0C31C8|nr:septum formation family protein [Blastococcus sp. TF02-8]
MGHAGPAPETLAAAPAAGTCWEDTTPGSGLPLDETVPVACGQPHHAETVVANEDVFAAGMAYPTLRDLGSDPANRQTLHDICSPPLVVGYLGLDVQTELPPYALYVTTAARLPNKEEWAAGARWIRCDIVYGMESGDSAPGRMAGGLVGPQGAAYHLCFTGTSDDFEPTSCAAPHSAEALGEPYQLPPLTPWPGDTPARQELRETCAGALPYELSVPGLPDGTQVDVFVGTEDSWDAFPLVACVLTPTAGGEVTTTLLQ